MKETGKERFILTKTYEVVYAVFRLAERMQEKDFAESLRASGTALLAAAAAEDYAATERPLRVTECLVKFGGDVGMIGSPNVEVMMREIYALDAAIVERKAAVKTDEVSVAEIFSKPEIAEHSAEVAPAMVSMTMPAATLERESGNPAIGKRFGNPAKYDTGANPAIRQLPVEGNTGCFAEYERADHPLRSPDAP